MLETKPGQRGSARTGTSEVVPRRRCRPLTGWHHPCPTKGAARRCCELGALGASVQTHHGDLLQHCITAAVPVGSEFVHEGRSRWGAGRTWGTLEDAACFQFGHNPAARWVRSGAQGPRGGKPQWSDHAQVADAQSWC